MTLAEIILTKIPPALLERVVFDQGVLDAQKRVALFKASGLSAQQIADRVVAEYGAKRCDWRTDSTNKSAQATMTPPNYWPSTSLAPTSSHRTIARLAL